MILLGKIGEERSARALSHVIGNIENPKPYHEGGDGAYLNLAAIAEEPAYIGGETDYENGDHDGDCAAEDERAAAAEPARASVADESDQRLNEQAGKRAAKPDDAGPSVRDSELLHVRREQRQL